MSIMSKKVIFGKKTGVENNTIFVREVDFQNPRSGDESTKIALETLNQIKEQKINGKNIPELFAYENISLWWFLYRQLYVQLQEITDFITNFLNFIEKNKPNELEIVNEFDKFEILKQICNQRKISFKYSKFSFLKFIEKEKIKQLIRNKVMATLAKKRFHDRKKLFNKIKSSPPEMKDGVIFAAAQRFRQNTFNVKTAKQERGEHLVQHVMNLLENEKIIGIDLLIDIQSDDKILNERLESKTPWFPIEILLENRDESKKLQFLKNYNDLILTNEFQSLFNFKGIKIWGSIKNIFEKMKYAPYLPHWIDLIDSIIISFSKTKPKAVLLFHETGPLALCFIAACKKIGIKTIGVQTGYIHKFHSNYSHDKIADLEHPFAFPLPDKLLLYGEYTKKLLIEKGYPSDKLVVFGNPVFFNLEKIHSILNKKLLFEKYGINKNKKIILYTASGLQESYEKNIKHDYDSQAWRYLLENFSNKEDFYLILKPHPRENPVTYEKILNEFNPSNAQIIREDLLELIHISSTVISIMSTTIFDSVCMKKPVIQLKFDNSYSTPLDDYPDVVLNCELSNLLENIQRLLSDEEIQLKLYTNSRKFIKESYNIPEKNPELILKELLKN